MAWLFILFALVIVRPAPCWGQISPASFQLALEWPNAYCAIAPRGCSYPIPQRFTIHGVFGMDQYDQPLPCHGNARPMTLIEKQSLKYFTQNGRRLITDLNIHWPNLTNRHHNMAFWDSEFAKHASCFHVPPVQFFQNAINLKLQLDNIMRTNNYDDPTLAVLQQNGVRPSDRVLYNASQFVRAINGALNRFNAAVQVKCDRRDPHQMLEIYFCIDLNWTPRRCNQSNYSIDCVNPVRFATNPHRVFNSSTPIASAPGAISDSDCDGAPTEVKGVNSTSIPRIP